MHPPPPKLKYLKMHEMHFWIIKSSEITQNPPARPLRHVVEKSWSSYEHLKLKINAFCNPEKINFLQLIFSLWLYKKRTERLSEEKGSWVLLEEGPCTDFVLRFHMCANSSEAFCKAQLGAHYLIPLRTGQIFTLLSSRRYAEYILDPVNYWPSCSTSSEFIFSK